MRSRMTRISASRFGAHTSCIRDMEVGGGGGSDDERPTLRASAGGMVVAIDGRAEITFASAL